MNKREKEIALKRIYAKVPRVACKGLCQACCGPIGMTPMEAHRLNRAAGHKVNASKDLTCSALVDGRCSAYESRPLICRLWGASEAMPCHHGCEIIDNDGKPLTADECSILVNQSVDLDPGPPVWTLPEDEVQFMQKLARQGLL